MKIILFRILMLSSLFVLASCQNDVEDVNSSEKNSTFELGEIQKVSFATFASDSNWPDLKDRAVVDLRVCILDRVYLENIVGEDFKIHSDLGSKEDPSDAKGCINWQEKFEFDYTADETFLTISGNIQGGSNFKGERNFKLAVNPWTKEVIDLAKGGSVQKVKSILSDISKKTFKKQLDVTTYNVEVDKIEFINGEAKLNLITILTPTILRRLIDGKKANPAKLTGGKFKLEYLLVQREKSTNERTTLAEAQDESSINEEGKLISKISLHIAQEIKADSNLELMVRTKPVNAPLNIGSDEGYFSIDSLVDSNNGTFKDLSMNFNAIKGLAKQADRKSGDSIIDHGIILDSIAGISVVNHGEGNLVYNSTSRTTRSAIAIKLVDSLVFKGVNSDFEVEMIDTKTNEKVYSKIRETDKQAGSGVIKFTPDFNFDESFEYGYRDYILRVRGTKAPFKDIVQERVVWVNPRLNGAGFLLDTKNHDTKPETEDLDAPEVFVREFNFDFISNDEESSYRVNKNLDLVSNRVVRVSFKPELKMLNNPEGDNNPKLTTGLFEATLMILAPKNPLIQTYSKKINLEDFDLLTGDKVDVVSEGGIINIDFQLPHLFDERMYLSFKNLAVLKVAPKAKNSAIRPGLIMGTVEILKKSGKVTSLFDSRVKNESELLLEQGNKILVNKFVKNDFKYLKNKLEEDHHIGDRYELFKNNLLSNRIDEKVLILDHKNYTVKNVPVEFEVSDNEAQFTGNNELKITPEEVTDMIVNLVVSDDNLKDMCKLFYNPKQITKVMFEGATGGGSVFLPTTKKYEGLEYKRCQRNPFAHIDLKELKFMEKILQQPKELREKTGSPTVIESSRKLARSEAYFVSKGEMFSKIDGTRESNFVGLGSHNSIDLSGKIFGGPLSFFSALGPDIGSRTDYYSMSQDAKILSNQRRIINQDGQTFQLSEVSADFEARIKKCLLIVPKYVKDDVPKMYQSTFGGLKSMWNEFTKNDTRATITSPKRHLVCMKDTRDEILNEMWFFVKLAGKYSDSDSDMALAKNSVGSVIRGRKAYDEFRILDLNNDKRVVVNTESKEEVVRRYKNFIKSQGKDVQYKDRVGTGYPGLIESD
ncbi:MAG: hypothetical protein ACJAS4_000585 [Bacteriovoracaceae bacterium]|jgi:hypothetical protein